MTTTTAPAAHRTPINPTTWSAALGFDQAHLVEEPTRFLVAAGQGSIDADGHLLHEDDLEAQICLALENIETLLAAAGMGPADLVRLTIFTLDVPGTLEAWATLTERLSQFRATPPSSLIGVSALALPGMLVEIEATAAR